MERGLKSYGPECNISVHTSISSPEELRGEIRGATGRIVQSARARNVSCKLLVSFFRFGERVMTLAGLEPAIFGSEDQRLIH